MLRIVLFFLLTLSLPASAQIYKYTDANGKTVFSDQPPTGQQAQSVELPPVNAMPRQVITKPVEHSSQAEESGAPYKLLRMADLPNDGGAVRANNGHLAVSVDIAPPLKTRHRLQLLLDGEPYGEPSRHLQFQLEGLNRGEHRLSVEVLSGNTRVQQSETALFTVQRNPITSNAATKAAQAPKAPQAKRAP